MEFDLQQIIEQYGPWVVSGVLKVVGALILLLIGLRIAGMLADFVRKESTKRENVDSTLGNFFASIVRWGMIRRLAHSGCSQSSTSSSPSPKISK